MVPRLFRPALHARRRNCPQSLSKIEFGPRCICRLIEPQGSEPASPAGKVGGKRRFHCVRVGPHELLNSLLSSSVRSFDWRGPMMRAAFNR